MTFPKALLSDLEKNHPGRIHRDVSLSSWTTFQCSSRAWGMVSPRDRDDLMSMVEVINQADLVWEKQWRVIGRGSNVLVRDGGYSGILIDLSQGFSQIEDLSGASEGEKSVRAEAGVSNGALLHWLKQNGLGGFGFSYGIPGTVGGGIRMNAGTPLGSFSQIVRRVEGVSRQGQAVDKSVTEADFSYRSYPEGAQWIITAGHFTFPFATKDEIDAETEAAKKKRSNQPLELPNIGSVFKNPENDFAGRLIETAGLKGERCGNAQISEKHANFIVNLGNARTQDALTLIEKAKKAVREKFGVELEEEVHVFGDDLQ